MLDRSSTIVITVLGLSACDPHSTLTTMHGDPDAGDVDSSGGDVTTDTDPDTDTDGDPDIVETCTAPYPDLRAWYRFDESAGASRVEDSSTCGNHGAATNVSVSQSGVTGTAYGFDGTVTPSFVEVPSSDSLRDFTELSVTAWVRREAGTDNLQLVSWVGGPGGNLYYFGLFLESLALGLSVVPSCIGMGSFPEVAELPEAAFIHIAMTYNSATGALTYYQNGVFSSTQVVGDGFRPGFCTQPSNMVIGAMDTSGSGNWQGEIDELKIWGVVLNAEQVCLDAGGTWLDPDCTL